MKRSSEETQDTLRRMNERQRHRGPDGSGQWIGEDRGWTIALGHRRLAIIDREGGSQPLAIDGGSIRVTFNGEIFNFTDLREQLEGEGRRFTTRSDTEVIARLFAKDRELSFARLNGMFAFAVWDSASGGLWLARDRAGIKPLYYAATHDGGLVFASELTALLEHPNAPRNLSEDALCSYFFSDYARAPLSFVEGVRKLEPGCFVVWKNGALSAPSRFWSLDALQPCASAARASVLADELLSRMQIAVDRQLIAEVPVGVFLSGGIDSSLVAALAQRRRSERLKTFSVGFEDPAFDESAYARMVARHIGSENHEEILHEGALLESIDGALDALDEPIADPSILPTFVLSRLAAKHVKVVLSGDGGDELWGGYPTYQAHRYAGWYALIPGVLRRSLIEAVARRATVGDGYQTLGWKLKRFVLRWDDDPLLRHFRWMSNVDINDLQALLPSSRAKSRDWFVPKTVVRRAATDFPKVDFQSYLPGSVLAKVDRAAMTHGLEVRPPFLDHENIEWAYALPPQVRLCYAVGKGLLKQAAASYLPSQIVNRRKKGFAIPLSKWLCGPLRGRVEQIFYASPVWDWNLFDRKLALSWRERHEKGRGDFARAIWALLVLDHWARRVPINRAL